MKKLAYLFYIAISVAFLPSGIANENSIENKIMTNAYSWENKGFRVGLAEQCMNWTREVLAAACGAKFKELQTIKPWDKHLLGKDDRLLAEHADSLASSEFGDKIDQIEDTKAGDLIFLKNTYGNWKAGVITHVGIATGEGSYIHRMTSNDGIVRVQKIPEKYFVGAIRLNNQLCN